MVSEPTSNDAQLNPDGNPQGKGMVPVLDALNALAPWQPDAKSAEQILKEFCLSTLVLSARFDFRVVPNQDYWLYRVESGWQLSMISPEEWRGKAPGPFVARCSLAQDMTWSLELAADLGSDEQLVEALEQHLQGFVERVSNTERLEEALPVYEQGLPYQQRMMATVLASSLQTSMILSGLSGAPSRHWLTGNIRQVFLPQSERPQPLRK